MTTRITRRAGTARSGPIVRLMEGAPTAVGLDVAPAWLPGGHAQTIWSSLVARRGSGLSPRWQRERWTTPDGDFIDVDWLHGPAEAACPTADAGWSSVAAQPDPDAAPARSATPGVDAPQAGDGGVLLVLFHGLEGSSSSHYAQAFADQARRLGWRFAVPHFRGCSGELNLAPRAYHSGDYVEIGWMLSQLRQRHHGAIHVVGVSLGGNALLRWAEEAGQSGRTLVDSVTAVCAPIDLTSSGHAIGQGLCRWIYTPMFLRSMKPKALAKLVQYPGLFDRERLLAAHNLYEFDDVFTAPLHGFAGTDDYWSRASAAPALADIRLPTLVVNAANDPFVPVDSLPPPGPVGDWVYLLRPASGGHVGFTAGGFPGHVTTLPRQVTRWMSQLA
ncbi:MAG: hypothetical protein RL375_3686 [Pseudomonadota bacterium]